VAVIVWSLDLLPTQSVPITTDVVSFLWFSPGPPVSSTNKTDRHDITEILLKVALNTIKPNQNHMNMIDKTADKNVTKDVYAPG